MITTSQPQPLDFKRIGDRLSAYTEQKQAPPYNPLSVLFQERAGKSGVRGEAMITQNWGKIEIDMLFVEERHRRKGVGKKLMRAINDFALSRGVRSIRLNTPTWQGEGFYEKVGFTEMGRVPLDPDGFGRPQFEITYFKVLPQTAEGEDAAAGMSQQLMMPGVTTIAPRASRRHASAPV